MAATVAQDTPNGISVHDLLRNLLPLAAFLEVSIVEKAPPEAFLVVAGAAKVLAAPNISEARHYPNLAAFRLSIVVDVVSLLCKVDGDDDGVVSLLYECVVLNTWH